MLGGPFVEGEPPVYDDEIEDETESVENLTTTPDETESDLVNEDSAGCKAVLPAVSIFLPTAAGLLLICNKRKKNKK